MQLTPPLIATVGMVMPKALNHVKDCIDRLLAPYSPRRLSTKEIKSQSLKYSAGWIIESPVSFEGHIVFLHLLITQNFPYEIPDIRIASPEIKPLAFPHLESDGKLCVWSERYCVTINDYSYIKELLSDAVNLLTDAIEGKLEDHFFDEFLSYWAYYCKFNHRINCLCSYENKVSRQVFVFQNKQNVLTFADDKNSLVKWLDNKSSLPSSNANKPRERALGSIQTSAIICFGKPWHPSQFPKSGKELTNLIENEFPNEADEIMALLCQSMANQYSSTPSILVSFETQSGPCFGSIVFARGLFTQQNRKSVLDGFRNSIPLKDFKNRIKTISVFGGMVNRVDQSWSMGRDVNHSWFHIKNETVAIIGCGSVGASIARLLVQSGVSNLQLFDGDILKAENVSRHALGQRELYLNKAKALGDSLARDFPFVTVDVYPNRWQDVETKSNRYKNEIEKADVILSCTGDWYSDQMLINLQSEYTLSPIVFAFVEAHALASHVIVNPVDSNAFNSIHYTNTNKVGKMRCPVTHWDNDTTQRIPACAGEFQPYGVIPMTHLHAMASEVVLDLLLLGEDEELMPYRKIWFDSGKALQSLNGDWSIGWKESYGDPKLGKYQQTIDFDGEDWVARHD
jgi:hypothetical protein